jgi:hypothetical protein
MEPWRAPAGGILETCLSIAEGAFEIVVANAQHLIKRSSQLQPNTSRKKLIFELIGTKK